MSLVLSMLAAWLATVLVEGLAMLLLTRNWRNVWYTVLLNTLTNPAMNLILFFTGWLGGVKVYYPALTALEILVVLGEGLLLAKLCGWKKGKALAVSLLLNALSFGVGLLVSFLRSPRG